MTTELDKLEVYSARAGDALYMLYEAFCMGQVRPDGGVCEICGDNDHQAFECRFNPFVRLPKIIEERRNLNDANKKDENSQKTDEGTAQHR